MSSEKILKVCQFPYASHKTLSSQFLIAISAQNPRSKLQLLYDTISRQSDGSSLDEHSVAHAKAPVVSKKSTVVAFSVKML